MRLNRTVNTKRNIIVGEIDRISGIILPFFVRTMIIHLIGADYLGLTSLFYSVLQMLNLVEMGFGTALVYSMYKPIAENDTERINALVSFYARVYHALGLVVGVIGLALIPFLPKLIHGTYPANMNLVALYLIYLVNTCLNYFIFPERKALLNAHQRDDLSGKIHIFTQIGMYLAQAAAIWFARDYYLYALMMPASTIAFSVLCGLRVGKKYPDYLKGGQLPSDYYAEIKKQVAGLMIRKIAVLSRNAFDSMFVSAYLGLTITAIYANYYYILDSIVMLIAVVRTSMAGGIGNSIAMENPEKNRQDFKKIDFLFMWISGWCAICLLCLYQPFMRIWTGESMMLPFGYAILFAVYFYILKMSDIRTLYSESAGIWWEARYISVLEALANLLLNWLLIRFLGLSGIILATLISYFLFNFCGGAVILFRVYFKEGGIRDYFLSHVKYAVITAGVGFLTCAAASKLPFTGWLRLLTTGLLCVILPNILYFLCYRRTEEFAAGAALLKRLTAGRIPASERIR